MNLEISKFYKTTGDVHAAISSNFTVRQTKILQPSTRLLLKQIVGGFGQEIIGLFTCVDGMHYDYWFIVETAYGPTPFAKSLTEIEYEGPPPIPSWALTQLDVVLV